MYERLHQRMRQATGESYRAGVALHEHDTGEWFAFYGERWDDYQQTGNTPYQSIKIELLKRNGRTRDTVPVNVESANRFEALATPFDSAEVTFSNPNGPSLRVSGASALTAVLSSDLSAITYEELESLLDDIENILREYKEDDPLPLARRVFIGHGGDEQWRILKDRLQDSYKLEVEAFESIPRAGTAINQVLEGVLVRCDVGVFVMSAGDTTSEGRKLARQNVVHEVGLFQGRLGWGKAIVVLENGVEEFSNLAGTQQIRFDAGKLADKAGDVALAIEQIRTMGARQH